MENENGRPDTRVKQSLAFDGGDANDPDDEIRLDGENDGSRTRRARLRPNDPRPRISLVIGRRAFFAAGVF